MIKKIIIPLAAILLASCTSDTYTGPWADRDVAEQPAAIVMGSTGANAQPATRASVQDAAELLGGSFRVYAVNDGGVVFNNYQVYWTGAPGSTVTDVAGWEYQGYMSKTNPATLQGIKFWDESSSRYDFVAFSGLSDDQQIQRVDSNTFAVDTASMQTFYVANRVSAAPVRIEAVPGVSPEFFPYQESMKFVFKRMSARLRVGFYETVAGYAVKDMRFYYADNADAPMGTSAKTEVGIEGQFPTGGDYTIWYDADNVAHADLNSGAAIATYRSLGSLDYGRAEAAENTGYLDADGTISSKGDSAFIGENSTNATYALSEETLDGKMAVLTQWHPILPYEKNDSALHLRCDYTLVATDGKRETLHVRGAEVYVPPEYCHWRSNYAYTYLFKISDRTGYSGDDSPLGLYPITFDAVVEEPPEDTQKTSFFE